MEESRILVAQNFLLLTELCSDYMEPVFPAIISLMFYYLMNDVPEVAIISTEFFGTYSLKAGTDKSLLMPILPQILSTCLSQMSLSESDISEFEEAELEYNQPDRLEDIKPIHYNRKKDDISSSGADFDGSDSEDVDEDEYGEWNIRKCSARTIDNLACAYKDDLLPLILPIIGKSLESQNWIQCESGILALGAISNGCAQGLRIHLPNLVEYLIRLCNSAKLAVSVISCWTLSRFSSWIMSEENRDKFAPLALEATLNAMQQKNRKLQEASCTSFANFCECSEGYFGKFGSVITTCLLQCLQKYQIRNSTILYAAIATFVRNIDQNSLKETGYFFHLTGSMLSRWKSLSKTDMTIINLMESVLGIIEASGELYAQFFEETLHLSLKQCDHILVEIQNYEIEIHSGNEKIEEPNRDFFICSLDMLGGLAESLGLGAANSFCSHLPEILQFLHSAITDGWASVRQSGLGLLGELLRVIPSALEPHLNQLLPHVISNLSEHFPAVCNNAGWVIGELAAAIGPKVSIYISDILPRISLLYLDASGDSIENLLLNMSITMGRLAHVCPEKVSTCTPELLRLWLQYLGRYTDDNEKFLAVMGALRVFQVNMQKLVLLLPDLVCLLVMMKDMTQQIREFATHIIIEYQRGLGPQQWAVATQRLSQRSKDLFKQNFGIAI